MRKIIFTVSLILMLAMSSVLAFGQDVIAVSIDSTKVEFNSETGSPFIDQNSRTQVPFRATLEQFGAKVDWNNETYTAIATKNDITVEVPVGQNYIIKNGEKIDTDTAAIIENNRTYLPIRAVVEAFGSEVQWDEGLKTVVITSTPIDAKAILMDAYAKSADWDSYDSSIVMDMSVPVPDENGNVQNMAMKMNMSLTAFTKPQKIKVTSNLAMDFAGQTINQPVMDMYVTIDDNNFVTYMGAYDAAGKQSWTKSTIEDALLSELSSYDMQANLELTEKYTKDVKYFGKYTDESGKTLLRIQNTLSGEIYTELLGTYIEQLAGSTNSDDILAADMLNNLGDFKFIMYVDEATGEIVKYEMDLSSIFASMFNGVSDNDSISQEDQAALEMLKDMKATMIMNITSVNQSEEFVIPQEVLDAPEASDLVEDNAAE
nr:copper amine oxidase N-terminal domain-containing protein [Sedimentibacter sp.]